MKLPLRALRRLLLAALTTLLATALLYVSIRLVPGTPWAEDLSTPRERLEEWSHRHHLDRPFAVGYLLWLRNVARGDLGESFSQAPGRSVAEMIRGAAPTSLALGILGFGAALPVAVGLALAAARRPGGAFDRTGSAFLYVLHAAPIFWVAMLLQELFALRLEWLPALGSGPLRDGTAEGIAALAARGPFWILPPACLALGSLAFLFRFTRAGVLEAAAGPSVRAARARGIPERAVLGRHAFSATRLHLVTLLGLLAPSIISGSVIIEHIFALPGLGRLFFDAVGARDYPVVMGVGLVMAVASIAASAAADILYLAVDPRLRARPEARP